MMNKYLYCNIFLFLIIKNNKLKEIKNKLNYLVDIKNIRKYIKSVVDF